MNDFMASVSEILNIDPPHGIAGGELVIECEGFDTSDPSECEVLIETHRRKLLLPGRAACRVNSRNEGWQVEVRLKSKDQLSEPAHVTVAKTGRRSAPCCQSRI